MNYACGETFLMDNEYNFNYSLVRFHTQCFRLMNIGLYFSKFLKMMFLFTEHQDAEENQLQHDENPPMNRPNENNNGNYLFF